LRLFVLELPGTDLGEEPGGDVQVSGRTLPERIPVNTELLVYDCGRVNAMIFP
jgi:hypothetical protein